LSPVLIANSANQELKVGFQVSPPFIIKDNNQYIGVSVDLWKEIADSLNIDYSFEEYGLQELLQVTEKGDIDVCIFPLTVTPSRIKIFDFTQPFYITNLAFATKVEKYNTLISFLSNIFSFGFLKVIIVLFLVILIFGFIIWLSEYKHNSKQFHKGIKGIGDGIWWSVVTMATVGYGDKAPKTPLGRIFSMIWMFAAIILISSLTASISSNLTIHKLKSEISSIDDLRKISVGCIPYTGTAEFLDHYRIHYTSFNNMEEGLIAVNNGSIKAFVYDNVILNYYIQVYKFNEVIKVIPSSYCKEYFSFASADSELIKRINEVLIRIIESPGWETILKKYHIEYRE
jgi:ABC-type amino acid transport substrate-binding protein